MSGAFIAAAVVLGAAYCAGWRRSRQAGRRLGRWRLNCFVAALLMLVAVGAWPLPHYAGSAIWAETLQFCVLAFGVTPLAVLGAPAAVLRPPAPGRRPSPPRAGVGWLALGGFVVVTVGWRVPPAIDALARSPWLLVGEAVTLVAGGWPLWEALVGSPLRAALAQRPRRMLLAALAAWSIWIFAYVVGFASEPFYAAYAGGAMDAQELSVALLWASSALAFVPVFFLNLSRWFATEDLLGEAAAALHQGGRRRGPLHGDIDRWLSDHG
jgi:cytochrome c oxidase assembly factor CtaG